PPRTGGGPAGPRHRWCRPSRRVAGPRPPPAADRPAARLLAVGQPGRPTRRTEPGTAAQRLTGLGLLTVPVTVATGLADWDRSSDDERVRRVGAVHAIANTAVSACYLASWWSRRSGHRARGIVLGLAGGVLAIGSGYLGGHLSFARAAGVEERGLTPEVA